MTARLWMLSWLLAVLPDVGELRTPTNVTLTSLDFTYILEWEAGPGTPEGVHYEVIYLPDKGYTWARVPGCEHVQKPLVCNLTAVFSDLTETYFMNVTAHLGEQASPVGHYSFKPLSQLSLPLLSVRPGERGLRLDLQPPTERFRNIYNLLFYEIQISSSKDKPQSMVFQSLRTRWWTDLEPGRRYCVAVRFKDRYEEFHSNFSRPKCVDIPANLSADPLISGAMCSAVIVMAIVIIMLILTGFICLRRRPLPSVLTTIHNLDEVPVVDGCIISSLLTVEPPAPSAGEKRSSRSSSDESDEDGETESSGTSTGGAYTQRLGANPLYSSSSSSSCLSQPKLLPDFSSNQLPSSQPGAQISTGSPSRAAPELSTDCGGRLEEEEEEEDVNLLTLTFGRVDQENKEEEEEEKSDLSVQQVETDCRLPSEDATGALQEEEEEEEEEEESGYIGRLRV